MNERGQGQALPLQNLPASSVLLDALNNRENEVSTYAKAETLVGAVVAPMDWARSVALVVAFSLLTALAAQVVVPLPWTPVPLTGQTFAVLLTGALLGSRLGALAMIAYLVEGAIGLPFFRAGAGGVGHFSARLGATFWRFRWRPSSQDT